MHLHPPSILLSFLVFLSTSLQASPLEEITSLSELDKLDMKKLEAGEILMDQMRLDNVDRGIAGQACFIVKETFANVAKRLERWETCHEKPAAPYFHTDLVVPLDLKAFEELKLPASEGAIKWLLQKTRDTRADRSDLNFSGKEAALISELSGGKDGSPESAAKAWKIIISQRAKQYFEKGFAGLAPLEMDKGSVVPVEELKTLLEDLSRLKPSFDRLFQKAFFLAPTGKDQTLYWELLKQNDHATFNLGTICHEYDGNKFKALNCDYYISNETYVSCTLYQLWPIEVGGKPATLIWRGQFASSPRLNNAKGVERLAAKKIMLKDLKGEIETFRKMF